jgi:hypothetical protein
MKIWELLLKLQQKKVMLTHHLKLVTLFTLLFVTVSFSLNAQKRTMVYGYVLDSLKYSPIKNAVVLNTNSNKTTSTNNNGIFGISVNINDVLFITANGYHFDTLRYTMLTRDTLFVYMNTLSHILPGVTVTAKGYTKYQLDSISRRDEFLAAAGGEKKPVATNATSGAGIGFDLDLLLSKKERDKRKAYKQFDAHEKEMYVDFRFSRKIVTDYTGLTGDTLSRFMRLYTPSYEWLRSHQSDEDIFYYLNDKLQAFYKRRDQ